MTTYLTYDGHPPRVEVNEAVIANLVRKGWIISDPPIVEEVPPPVVPRWVDFSAAIMAMPAINVMLGAVLQAAPGLYGGLVVGLQNASEGDSRVFLNSWHAAIAMTLVSEELITTVQGVAGEYDLPQEFIGALVPLSPV
jgi:hypothetical protein